MRAPGGLRALLLLLALLPSSPGAPAAAGAPLPAVAGGEEHVNAELVRLGSAQVMTVPPNVRHAELFHKLAVEAREHRRGLWAVY